MVDKEKWEKKILADCINTIKVKEAIQKRDYQENGKYPIISQEKDFISGYCDSEEILNSIGEVVIFGDHTRVVKFVDFDFCVGADGVKVLRPNERISPKYLFYFLKWADIPNNGYSRHFKYLKELKISYPSLPVQLSIARELDSVQAMIDGYRQQIADLDALAQSIFLDTFGDPVSNPKGWEMSNYDCQFKVSSGGTPSKKVAEYWNGGDIPWIGSNMCTNSILYKTDGKTITQLGLDNSSAKIFPSGTILVALVGATIGKCGLLAIPTSTNQNIAGLNIKDEDTLTPLYAFYHTMFLYPLFQDIGDGKFTISNQGFIKKLPICLPPLPLQHHFAAQIESIEKQKEQLRRQQADAETLMAERMQYYFA